ncbi:hypothetical protein APHAL10511_003082 [Amanita phalloides]|nr:hypothetical protein APHAL10511_003082 [Amanita phalloides]
MVLVYIGAAALPHWDLTGKVHRTTDFPEHLGQHSDFYVGKPVDPKDVRLPSVFGIKVFRGGRAQDKDFMDKFYKNYMEKLSRWVEFEHDNIARCYGYATDCGPMPALIMDYYPRGNITQFLKAGDTSFNQRVELIRGIAEGINYLHGKGVVHGDLRAANIFVDNAKRAKIADFELVYIIDTQEFTSYKPAGSARWIAPEIMTDADDELYGGPKYTNASDIFAFAMIIIEVFTGDVPFAAKRQDLAVLRIISEGKRPDIPDEVSKHQWLCQLMKQCWAQDPLARPTAEKIVQALTTNTHQPKTSWFPSFSSLWRFVGL